MIFIHIYFPFAIACPVGGQIRIECASPCNVTCANADTLLICPTVCVINGCQCPRDTVIDEQSNTCVPRSDCPSSNTGSYSISHLYVYIIRTAVHVMIISENDYIRIHTYVLI